MRKHVTALGCRVFILVFHGWKSFSITLANRNLPFVNTPIRISIDFHQLFAADEYEYLSLGAVDKYLAFTS
jgi:hypothetical protein